MSMSEEDKALYSELNPYRLICPICSCGTVVLGTKAGDRFGVCQLCYTKALTRVQKRQTQEAEAYREYKTAARQSQRARHSAGITVDPENGYNKQLDPFEVLSRDSVLQNPR